MKEDDLNDIITLVGELEHARRHLRLGAIDADTDEAERLQLTWANNLRMARRDLMTTVEVPKKFWCLFKSLCIIRQLILEIEWDETSPAMSNDLRFIEYLLDRIINVNHDQCAECQKI